MERVWACVFVELNESIPKQKLQFSVHQIDWVGKWVIEWASTRFFSMG